ncbi:MAG TPA: hypothetical protein VFZ68_10250 [Acidimicrobiales bacterium]
MPGEAPFFSRFGWTLWDVHDHPARPLDPGAMLCACRGCDAALRRQAEATPRLVLALATDHDRILVTAEYLVEVMAVDPSLSPLLYVHGDRVNGLYVPAVSTLSPPRRWRSARCDADERAAGRRHPRHRVAKRQSRASRLRYETAALPAGAAGPVDGDGARVELVPLATAVAPVRRRHDALLAAMDEWALARGSVVDLDVAALVLAAKQRWGRDEPLHRWTRTGVTHCLVSAVGNWCALSLTLRPEGIPETVWLLLDFLADTGRLDSASDPVGELRKPLRCYGGLDARGRAGALEVPDDGGGTDGASRCECYVAYRGPTHGEVSGAEAPVAPVRAASVRAATSAGPPGTAEVAPVPAVPTTVAGSTPCA